VILILADDQGSIDVGCYGTKDMHTPHTDALAARGVRFSRFYSAAPYRGAKFSLLEGGIRLPAIIFWPAKLPNNQRQRRQSGAH